MKPKYAHTRGEKSSIFDQCAAGKLKFISSIFSIESKRCTTVKKTGLKTFIRTNIR